MLATLKSKAMFILLAGTAWLGSHSSCDMGGVYNTFGGYYDTLGGYFVDAGGYYADPYWDNSYYDPYYNEYEAGYCCEDGYGY